MKLLASIRGQYLDGLALIYGENLPSGLLKVNWYLLEGPFGTL
jgi:hypothetical protein